MRPIPALYASPDLLSRQQHMRHAMPPKLALRIERAFAEVIDSAEPVVVEYSLELASGLCEFDAALSVAATIACCRLSAT